MVDMNRTRTDYAELLQQMEDGTLHTCAFDHAAHMGVAYEALERHQFFEALAIFARGIQRAAEVNCEPGKFNATTTMVFMSLIAERRDNGTYADADDFVARNRDLGVTVLDRWYSPERRASEQAQRIPLMPDRAGAAPA